MEFSEIKLSEGFNEESKPDEGLRLLYLLSYEFKLEEMLLFDFSGLENELLLDDIFEFYCIELDKSWAG